jgi:protoheme ferro-lyase
MRTGVILSTYGEPTRNSFPDQWMYSYRILQGLTRKIAKIPKPVLPLIATARARGRVKLWSEHQFLSPLEALHEQTVDALAAELDRRGHSKHLVVTSAYEFRRPGLAEALRALRHQGCSHACVVPMYIADGDFTDGMTRIGVELALRRSKNWADHHVSYCSLSGSDAAADHLARTLADHCLTSMSERGLRTPAKDWAIMLAAHGTVVTPPPGVDNGLLPFGRVLSRLRSILRPHVGLVRVGWLNHTRGGKWTTPAIGHALPCVQNRGFRNLVYFPWGFTTDNAETALEGRIALRDLKTPFDRVEYLPCLNTSGAFVSLLADRITERVHSRNAQAINLQPAA